MAKKHKYYITVPMTGSIEVVVETDEPIEDDEQAFELAIEEWSEGDYGLDIVSPRLKRAKVDLGEIDFHKQLNRGNVCHEIYWQEE